MKKPRKNILVYADGRVREIEQDLVGNRFIVPENVNGADWRREFEVHLAHQNGLDGPFTMVGIEREFRLHRTRKQVEKAHAEFRAQVMRDVLHGLDLVAKERDGGG